MIVVPGVGLLTDLAFPGDVERRQIQISPGDI